MHIYILQRVPKSASPHSNLIQILQKHHIRKLTKVIAPSKIFPISKLSKFPYLFINYREFLNQHLPSNLIHLLHRRHIRKLNPLIAPPPPSSKIFTLKPSQSLLYIQIIKQYLLVFSSCFKFVVLRFFLLDFLNFIFSFQF